MRGNEQIFASIRYAKRIKACFVLSHATFLHMCHNNQRNSLTQSYQARFYGIVHSQKGSMKNVSRCCAKHTPRSARFAWSARWSDTCSPLHAHCAIKSRQVNTIFTRTNTSYFPKHCRRHRWRFGWNVPTPPQLCSFSMNANLSCVWVTIANEQSELVICEAQLWISCLHEMQFSANIKSFANQFWSKRHTSSLRPNKCATVAKIIVNMSHSGYKIWHFLTSSNENDSYWLDAQLPMRKWNDY